jgi:hypothetical protein
MTGPVRPEYPPWIFKNYRDVRVCFADVCPETLSDSLLTIRSKRNETCPMLRRSDNVPGMAGCRGSKLLGPARAGPGHAGMKYRAVHDCHAAATSLVGSSDPVPASETHVLARLDDRSPNGPGISGCVIFSRLRCRRGRCRRTHGPRRTRHPSRRGSTVWQRRRRGLPAWPPDDKVSGTCCRVDVSEWGIGDGSAFALSR